MTTLGRRIDDNELDGLLRALLAEGPEVGPSRIAEHALDEIARTRQARRPLLGPVLAKRRVAPAWGVAATVVLAVTVGISVALPGIGPQQSPSPSPSPVPSRSSAFSPAPISTSASEPDAPVLFSSEDDGYELLVPASWVAVESGFPDARKWSGPGGELLISYGESIFMGGEVTVCGPPSPEWALCETHQYAYSVPYRPASDGRGPIDLSDYARDRCLGGCTVVENRSITLDGEDANETRTVAGGLQATWVSLFHDQRPVILYWAEPVEGADETRIDAMIASFQFLAADPGPGETPFVDPTELVPFADRAGRYEMLIPRFWALDVRSDYPGVQTFGSGRGAATRGYPALTVSVGTADGTITLCQGPARPCETVAITSLDDLDAALVTRPDGMEGAPADRSGELLLGGEAARWKRPGYRPAGGPLGLGPISGGNCLGCPLVYHAYTIKDGRPIVVTWDFWTLAFGAFDTDYTREIVESLRLLD